MKEIGLLVKILSGKTCGICMIGMSIPEEMELNRAMKQIINEPLVVADVEQVSFPKNDGENIVSFKCNIDNVKEAQLILNYQISNNDYKNIFAFYKSDNSPKNAKNNDKAIKLIKNIIDSYDPMIQVISD